MSGSLFMPTSTSSAEGAPDPTKHVNYVLGMVLGVDDFNQEFAYLDGRDRLIARELGGYGVLRGLRVFTQVDGQNRPEIVVSAGLAVSPDGHAVRVPLAQCAGINEWVKSNRDQIQARGMAPSGLTPAIVHASVVLAYAEQTTDLVPIPGEPCRTEDESMAASRVADDFRLELRFDPPEQREQDAMRQYLAWLAGGWTLVDTPGMSLRDFLDAIAKAAAAALKVTPAPVGSPPGTPPSALPYGADIFKWPAGQTLEVPRAQASQYLAEAFRFYATLRAEWQSLGATPDGTPPNEEGLLLAQVSFPIIVDSLTGSEWVLDVPSPAPPTLPVEIDESRRSRLLPLSYLQETMLALADRTQRSVTHLLGPGLRYVVAAAGTTSIAADEPAANAGPKGYNGLVAWASADGEVTVKFAGPNGPGLTYVVKALPWATPATPAFADPTVSFGAFLAAGPIAAGDAPRFNLRVGNAGAPVPKATLVGQKLMIEVSAFGNA
ncbi:Hypothetical protein A7982_02239 [Minicystis rosea]|nr:Hypothetical protein A7982_02239 [Minicystis rosea]